MFDWNDEEIANIIWGEDGEGDDHIVPLPGDSKDSCDKEQDQESAAKLTGLQTPVVKPSFGNAKLECSSTIDKKRRRSPEVSMHSWPDLSTSSFTKNVQGALTTELTNDLSETAEGVSEKTQPERDHQAFENPRDEDQNDFVGYGWENIGSFDDLERIFSQDEPLFGNVLSNADELWCPKDVTSSSLRSFSISGDSPDLVSEVITDASEILQVKIENEQQDDRSRNLLCAKLDDPPSLKEQGNFSPAGASAATSHLTADNRLTRNAYSDKVSRQKKHHKGQKKQGRKNEGRISTALYGAWSSTGNLSGQYEHHYQLAAPVTGLCVPSAMNQMAPLSIDSFQFQYMPNQYLQPHAYGNLLDPFPQSSSGSPTLQTGKPREQAMVQCEISPREINPLKRQIDSSDRPPTMTPQEKIEKLRRRQQMRAMLAIQKQQEQFNNQASSYSIPQKCPIESQVQRLDGIDFGLDHMSVLPPVDTSSAVEKDDSNTTSIAAVGYAAEESVLRRLQDIIGKLDSGTRLCIRDSLFRLAKSAVQRQYTSDTSSTNTRSKGETQGGPAEDNYADSRHVRMPDIETETNPIDRAVAHLLFHRPLESSVKHYGNLDSPISSKLPGESKTSNANNLFRGPRTEQGSSLQGPKSPQDNKQVDLLHKRSCLDTLEDTSNVGSRSDGAMEFEASQ
ncbi:hypothetical protein SAY87_011056 [Trapa incisa]|uniref:Protein LNK2 n=1 Tax=Trapa incisa TaxID=236973 RepID=A0AAN7JI20_9MYRT|nr:hypothetical protein SAY87_011056 [Trapa incisa]